ncbi:hypothetical protein EPUS_05626 [Endocarpon pusillum Z07020]|uniref:Uncharacterized protein n=1 Tax=Endocarpon pusillum (strain Z07020 / HMAS-L-300199) TaxID=1263415 RepID=U1FUK2_ENDPU|nr:uncharacterized protein EPUS_05626 [Endocarpon pusillum Z07020]ERF68487.1 hypothetical protein EPUS_05626 [Endocarpon pusillum Z07020]
MFSRKPHHETNANNGDNSTNYNDASASYGTGSGNTDSGRGPHKSSLLNKLDPRVDTTTRHQPSDTGRNGGGALGTSARHDNTGYGTSSNGHGDTTDYGSGIAGRSAGSTNVGPHDSSLANKTTQHNSGYSNPSPNTGYGAANFASGPHSSNFANKVDPRVDSDNFRGNHGDTTGNYSSSSGYYGSNTTSAGYGNTGSTTTRPHSSNLANKLDPRVGSDNFRGDYGSSTGTYTNANTANTYGNSYGETANNGPHKSHLMNKLDPRTDSDMDGSRNTSMGQDTNQSIGNPNTKIMPQEISSHAHATGGPAGALEGNISNATASAKVSGGMVPEGSADASGPLSADAGTTSSNQGGLKGAIRNLAGVGGNLDASIDNNNHHDRSGMGHQQVIMAMDMLLVQYLGVKDDERNRRKWLAAP